MAIRGSLPLRKGEYWQRTAPLGCQRSRFLSFRPARIANTQHSLAAILSEFRPGSPRSSFPRRGPTVGRWLGRKAVLPAGPFLPAKVKEGDGSAGKRTRGHFSLGPVDSRPVLLQLPVLQTPNLVRKSLAGTAYAALLSAEVKEGGRAGRGAHARVIPVPRTESVTLVRRVHPGSDDASASESWQRAPEACTPKPLVPPMAWHFTRRLTETAPAMAAGSRCEHSHRAPAATGGGICGRETALPGQTCGHPGVDRQPPSQTAHIGTLPPGTDRSQGPGEGEGVVAEGAPPFSAHRWPSLRLGSGTSGCPSGGRRQGGSPDNARCAGGFAAAWHHDGGTLGPLHV